MFWFLLILINLAWLEVCGVRVDVEVEVGVEVEEGVLGFNFFSISRFGRYLIFR